MGSPESFIKEDIIMQQQQVEVLVKKKTTLREKLEGILKQRDQKQKELLKEDEIRTVESAIEETDRLIREEQKRALTETLEVEAANVLADLAARDEHLKAAAALDEKVRARRERVAEQIPTELVQVSSRHFVVFQKEFDYPKAMIPLIDTGPTAKVDEVVGMKVEMEKITREEVVPCVPSQIEHFKRLGWTLKPGSEVVYEKLDSNNSVRRPVVPLLPALDPNFSTAISWRMWSRD
jgi:hypothetical protein